MINVMGRRSITSSDRERGRRLASALATAREQKRWSQSDLSKRADVRLDTIRKIEQGRVASPSFFIVADLVVTLGIELDEFINPSNQPKRTEGKGS